MNERLLLITGASSDIGIELVRRFASSHVTIAAHFHRNDKQILEIQQNAQTQARIVPVQADLSSPGQVDQLIARVSELGCPTDIIHLPALSLQLERFSAFDWSRVESDLQIQVGSIATILKSFLPAMGKAERRGKIVFVLSSVTLGVPPKMMSSYIVVKSALHGLMRTLAVEFGDKNVNINGVSPYTVETKFLAEVPAKYVEIAAAANPSKRNAQVTDVLAAMEFMLSGGSDFLSGVNLPVTGGSVF